MIAPKAEEESFSPSAWSLGFLCQLGVIAGTYYCLDKWYDSKDAHRIPLRHYEEFNVHKAAEPERQFGTVLSPKERRKLHVDFDSERSHLWHGYPNGLRGMCETKCEEKDESCEILIALRKLHRTRGVAQDAGDCEHENAAGPLHYIRSMFADKSYCETHSTY